MKKPTKAERQAERRGMLRASRVATLLTKELEAQAKQIAEARASGTDSTYVASPNAIQERLIGMWMLRDLIRKHADGLVSR